MLNEPSYQPDQMHQAQVDYDGLLEVLGKNLYSTPHVVLRELVQNALDSCTRRSLEDTSGFQPKVQVRIEHPHRLIVSDNGAGLTEEEVNRYLATLGAGYTRLLRGQTKSEELIGAFGLGFLSTYLVSQRVEVFTTSFQTPENTWRFSSRNGQRYTLSPVENREVGTTCILHLQDQYKDLSDGEMVRHTLENYCALLHLPVYLGEMLINSVAPPWRGGDTSQQGRLDFANRFETFAEPLCTIQLPKETKEETQGLLWIHDRGSYATSDNRKLQVYVRGMLVAENERDLLPKWAGFVSGVIESAHLIPTASRETLQKEAHFQATASLLHGALISGLRELANKEQATWRRVLLRHNEALLGAALADADLFDLLADDLRLPTTEGELTMPALVKRGKGKVYVSTGDENGADVVLYRALGKPVINGVRFAAMPFGRMWCESKGAEYVHLGTQMGNATLFPREFLTTHDQQRLEELFGQEGFQLVPTRFAPSFLPLVVVPNREAALKRRLENDEADKRLGASMLRMARIYTNKLDGSIQARMFVNLDSPLIQGLLADRVKRPTEVASMAQNMAFSLTGQDEDLPVEVGDALRGFFESFQAMALE